ncbi:MAG: EF-hand domain-containing protein [Candidatus Poseidoniales archaeon]|nr:MAG: EF-hand domain-containing protein [Candidatus Poseidoniales archaeon]
MELNQIMKKLATAMKEQKMSVADLFSQLDTDNDNRINGPELHKGISKVAGEFLSPDQISMIIQSIDTDSDNRVDMYELRVALENAK